MFLQVACGIIFGTIIAVPAHWFKRKLGAALGVMALGSSCGGTLYPIIVRNLIERVGYVAVTLFEPCDCSLIDIAMLQLPMDDADPWLH